MKKIQGASFGVRFYRRGVAKQTKEIGQDIAQDNLENKQAGEKAMDIPEQEPLKTAKPLELEPLIPDQKNEKALWVAARAGDCYAIRVLTMRGVDLDARDAQGRTAIHIATQYNQMDALKTLLAAKEMRRMAKFGELPQTQFFKKFEKKSG